MTFKLITLRRCAKLIFTLLMGLGYLHAKTVEIKSDFKNISPEFRTYIEQNLPEVSTSLELSNFIKQTYQQWPVAQMRVYKDESKDTWQVFVNIKQRLSAFSIDLDSAKHKRALNRIINLKIGSYIGVTDLQVMKDKTQAYLESEGFVAANIELTRRADASDIGIDIVLAIRLGPPCQISEVRIERIDGMHDPVNTKQLKIKSGDRCSDELIRQEVLKLEEAWQKMGYPKARVQNAAFISEQSTENKNALKIEYRLGEKVNVYFIGNTFVFERDALLKEVMGVGLEREFSESWIKISALPAIQNFYAAKGFFDVTVDYAYQKTAENVTITFRVERTWITKIQEINIEGVEKLELKEVKKALADFYQAYTRKGIFSRPEIELASEGLISFYQQKGFFQVAIKEITYDFSEDQKQVRIDIFVEEGERSIFGALLVKGNTVFTNLDIERHFGFEPGDPIDYRIFQARADRLNKKYLEMGYKYARVEVSPPDIFRGGKINLSVNIDEGKQIYFGTTEIIGNKITKTKIVNKAIKYKTGRPYNPNRIRTSRRNLLQTGIFDSVVFEEPPLTDASVQYQNIRVKLEEAKRRSVLLRPGFSTDDGVRGATELIHRNIGGSGKEIQLGARANRRLENNSTFERRLSFSYLDPFLVWDLRGRFTFINEQIDELQFDLNRTIIQTNLERNFGSRVRTKIGWNIEFRRPFNELEGAVLSIIDETEARFGSIFASVDLDLRNDLLSATEGSFHRIIVDVYDQSFLSEEEFFQVYIKNNFYIPFYKRIRSVLSLRTGISSTYGLTSEKGIETVPIEKRFRLGGASSLRGFRFNCVGGNSNDTPENCGGGNNNVAPGGNALFNYLFEVLLPLNDSIDIAVFTDGGNAYLANEDFNFFNLRYTAGLGIRFNTFFGPLRLDYGAILDRRPGEPFGSIHFAVGQF